MKDIIDVLTSLFAQIKNLPTRRRAKVIAAGLVIATLLLIGAAVGGIIAVQNTRDSEMAQTLVRIQQAHQAEMDAKQAQLTSLESSISQLQAQLTAVPPTPAPEPILMPSQTLTNTSTLANTPALPPAVSLVGLSYSLDGYNPRMIDLRTASSSGISVLPGLALKLFDLFVSVPADAPEYKVQAEIYINNRILGSTPSTPLLAGITKLGDVEIENYNNGKIPDAWTIQQDWKDLQVFLVTYREGVPVDRNLTTIRLNPDGASWLIDPPNMNLASIVYTVNDGPEMIVDLRTAESAGLDVKPNDKLTLKEIWYHSNADSDRVTAFAEACLLREGESFDSATDLATQKNTIQKGVHRLESSLMSWTIPEDRRFLDLTLYRSDDTVMDGLTLPLKSEK